MFGSGSLLLAWIGARSTTYYLQRSGSVPWSLRDGDQDGTQGGPNRQARITASSKNTHFHVEQTAEQLNTPIKHHHS